MGFRFVVMDMFLPLYLPAYVARIRGALYRLMYLSAMYLPAYLARILRALYRLKKLIPIPKQ
jgi:hypothetical protein